MVVHKYYLIFQDSTSFLFFDVKWKLENEFKDDAFSLTMTQRVITLILRKEKKPLLYLLFLCVSSVPNPFFNKAECNLS